MNPTALKNFYNNTTERESVKAFFLGTLSEMAVERVFEKKDVSGIADAKELVDKVFVKLEEMYGKLNAPQDINSR